jgi:hypothetical protein
MVKGTGLKLQEPDRSGSCARLFDKAKEDNSWRTA